MSVAHRVDHGSPASDSPPADPPARRPTAPSEAGPSSGAPALAPPAAQAPHGGQWHLPPVPWHLRGALHSGTVARMQELMILQNARTHSAGRSQPVEPVPLDMVVLPQGFRV